MVTIEEIEGDRWPEPKGDLTFLVTRCLALRRKPLAEFTVEDLRIMLGQQIAVPTLLPLAVEVLVRDPFAEGDFYPGDLLAAVLRLSASAWSGLRLERQRLAGVLANLLSSGPDVDGEVRNLIDAFLNEPT